MESICIFGDSIAWGAWDVEKGGWPNRLWLALAKKPDGYCEVYNLSIPGGTTETILSRFESEAKIRNADALIFQSGGNDSAFENVEGNYLVNPDKFRSNIAEIIEKAKQITSNIAFIGVEGCDEVKTSPVAWANVYYSNERIKVYNEIIREVCKAQGVLFLDLYGALDKEDLDDGLHPNVVGHEKIFNKVHTFLKEHKWIN